MARFFASLVIPVFNSASSLRLLLEALEQQSLEKPFEVIVVDDGSSEDIAATVEEFSRKLNLKFLRQEQNLGPAAARNLGIKAALGEIIVFTDADCQPQSQWLEKMLAPFSDEKVAGVKGVYETRQEDFWAQLAQIEFVERYQLMESLSEIDFIDTYSGAYRRRDLLEVKGFNQDFIQNEDVDLAFRIKKLGGRYVFAPEAKVFHQHREGWGNYAKLKFARGFWRMKVYDQHPEKALKDSYTPATLKMQLLLVILLPLAVFSSRLRFWWKTAWFFSCIPLMRIAFARKITLAMAIPLFCLIRGIALLAGMIKGIAARLP